MKKILLVEDHAIVRLATRFLIQELVNPVVVLEARSFSETLSLLAGNVVDLVVLDIDIPEGESVNMIFRIREMQPKLRILIFTSLEEEIYALPYIQAGANGFLSKTASQDEIRKAISAVLETGRYMSAAMQQLFRQTIEKQADAHVGLRQLAPDGPAFKQEKTSMLRKIFTKVKSYKKPNRG